MIKIELPLNEIKSLNILNNKEQGTRCVSFNSLPRFCEDPYLKILRNSTSTMAPFTRESKYMRSKHRTYVFLPPRSSRSQANTSARDCMRVSTESRYNQSHRLDMR